MLFDIRILESEASSQEVGYSMQDVVRGIFARIIATRRRSDACKDGHASPRRPPRSRIVPSFLRTSDLKITD